MNLRLNQAGCGSCLHIVGALAEARVGPRVWQEGREQSVSTRMQGRAGTSGAGQPLHTQQLTRYIPVANLRFTNDMR